MASDGAGTAATAHVYFVDEVVWARMPSGWAPAVVVDPPSRFVRSTAPSRHARALYCVALLPLADGAGGRGGGRLVVSSKRCRWADPSHLLPWRAGLEMGLNSRGSGRRRSARESGHGTASEGVDGRGARLLSTEPGGAGADASMGEGSDGSDAAAGAAALGADAAKRLARFNAAVAAARALEGAGNAAATAQGRALREAGIGPVGQPTAWDERGRPCEWAGVFVRGDVYCVGDVVRIRGDDGLAWHWEGKKTDLVAVHQAGRAVAALPRAGEAADECPRLARLTRVWRDHKGSWVIDGEKFVRDLDAEAAHIGDTTVTVDLPSGESEELPCTTLRVVALPFEEDYDSFRASSIVAKATPIKSPGSSDIVRVDNEAYILVEPEGDFRVPTDKYASCALCASAALELDGAAQAPDESAHTFRRRHAAATAADVGALGPLLSYQDIGGKEIAVHLVCAAVLPGINMVVLGNGMCNVNACVSTALDMRPCTLCGSGGASLQVGASLGRRGGGAADDSVHVPCAIANPEYCDKLAASAKGGWLGVYPGSDLGTGPGIDIWWDGETMWVKGWVLNATAARTYVLCDNDVQIVRDLRSGSPAVARRPVGIVRQNDPSLAGARVRVLLGKDTDPELFERVMAVEYERMGIGDGDERGPTDHDTNVPLSMRPAFQKLMAACSETGQLADAEAAWEAGERALGGAEWRTAILSEPSTSANNPLLAAVQSCQFPNKRTKGHNHVGIVRMLLAHGMDPDQKGYCPPRAGDGLRQESMFVDGMSARELVAFLKAGSNAGVKIKSVAKLFNTPPELIEPLPRDRAGGGGGDVAGRSAEGGAGGAAAADAGKDRDAHGACGEASYLPAPKRRGVEA